MYGHLLPALQRQTSLCKNLTSQSRIATTASPKNQKMVSVDFRNWPMHFDMDRCTSKIDRCTCIDANWCGSAPGVHMLSMTHSVRQRNLMMHFQCPLPVYYSQLGRTYISAQISITIYATSRSCSTLGIAPSLGVDKTQEVCPAHMHE